MQEDDRRPAALVDVEDSLPVKLERLAALPPGVGGKRCVFGLCAFLGLRVLAKGEQGNQRAQCEQGQHAQAARQARLAWVCMRLRICIVRLHAVVSDLCLSLRYRRLDTAADDL